MSPSEREYVAALFAELEAVRSIEDAAARKRALGRLALWEEAVVPRPRPTADVVNRELLEIGAGFACFSCRRTYCCDPTKAAPKHWRLRAGEDGKAIAEAFCDRCKASGAFR